MKSNNPQYTELLVLCYCLIFGAGIVKTWGDSPYTKYAMAAFLVYLIPISLYWIYLPQEKLKTAPLFQYLAIVATTLGYLSEFNLLKYSGIALAFTGLVPWSLFSGLWLSSSVFWIPDTGYFLTFLPPMQVAAIRLSASIAASFLLTMHLYSKNRMNHSETTL